MEKFVVGTLSGEDVLEWRFWTALSRGNLKAAGYWANKSSRDLTRFMRSMAQRELKKFGKYIAAIPHAQVQEMIRDALQGLMTSFHTPKKKGKKMEKFMVGSLQGEDVLEWRFWTALSRDKLKAADFWAKKSKRNLTGFMKSTAQRELKKYGVKLKGIPREKIQEMVREALQGAVGSFSFTYEYIDML